MQWEFSEEAVSAGSQEEKHLTGHRGITKASTLRQKRRIAPDEARELGRTK